MMSAAEHRTGTVQSAEIARVHDEFPTIAWTEVISGHDVAGAAPEPLIEAIRTFLDDRMDSAAAAE